MNKSWTRNVGILALGATGAWFGCATTKTDETGVNAAAESTSASEPGFNGMFNGRSLEGWTGDDTYWSQKDGIIEGRVTPETKTDGPSYLLWQDGKVEDFEMRFSFRFTGDKGNSGLSYRAAMQPDGQVFGYQADFEAGEKWNGILVEMGGRKFLGLRGERTRTKEEGGYEVVGPLAEADFLQSTIRKNDWNEYVVIGRGNRLQHMINGHMFVDVKDESFKAAKSGELAFQLNRNHIGAVQLKNVRMRDLKAEPVAVVKGGKELVWFDRELTFEGDRFFQANPLTDWTSPVDYANGTVEVRLVIKEKASDTPLWMEFVMWKDHRGGLHRNLGCLPSAEMTKPGTYTCSLTPSVQSRDLGADYFKTPFDAIQLSAKVADGSKRTTTELKGEHTPMVVRYTAVMVPKGQAFSGWAAYP